MGAAAWRLPVGGGSRPAPCPAAASSPQLKARGIAVPVPSPGALAEVCGRPELGAGGRSWARRARGILASPGTRVAGEPGCPSRTLLSAGSSREAAPGT